MEISILPGWLMNYFTDDCLRRNNINILFSNILIISVIVLFRNSLIDVLNIIPHFCLFDKIFHINCPVCGTTRALCEIAKGNIGQAIELNYSSLLIAAFFLLQIPLRLFSLLHNSSVRKVNRLSKYTGYTVLMITVVNWFYNLIKPALF